VIRVFVEFFFFCINLSPSSTPTLLSKHFISHNTKKFGKKIIPVFKGICLLLGDTDFILIYSVLHVLGEHKQVVL
jgi:hypothetical protein